MTILAFSLIWQVASFGNAWLRGSICSGLHRLTITLPFSLSIRRVISTVSFVVLFSAKIISGMPFLCLVGGFVVRVGVGQAPGVPVGEGRERGHLGDEPHHLLVLVVPVVHRLGLGVEGGQRGQGADQDAHRVSVVVEAVDELLDVLVHVGVVGDLVGPRRRLFLVRQLAAQQQPGHVQEGRAARQFLDRVTAVAQDALVAVDEGDGAAAARGVLEGGVVGKQSEVVIGGLDLPKVDRADSAVDDRDFVAAAGP